MGGLFHGITKAIGAVDQTNLEPAPLVSVLEELEQWEVHLKAEPEIIHKLNEFQNAAASKNNTPDKPTRPARSQRPSP
jgi:hypothetical protein